ncbi:MAG: ABC transporter ATP-binding protein [Candidatus Omnitrophica bacterium]|nr:ABC transporter ATP-binding protein [Candidatus Omnitrophota bacterium]MCM8831392.1 ABC transporter ATP-binding protein [Candidatus Omnitrophota bacterium]
MDNFVLQVKDLNISYNLKGEFISALENINFKLKKGEILGVVGESGSGKTTLALSILNLLPPDAKIEGQIIFEGKNIFSLYQKQLNSIRANKIGIIFQEPAWSFDPFFTISYQFHQLLKLKKNLKNKKEREYIIFDTLKKVKISNIDRILSSYPHQLSGGQLQRISIAMAISLKPTLLIADEPTSSLDVTAESQIIHLLKELQDTVNLTIIFITHNLELARLLSDKILVLYKAKMVELKDTKTIFEFPENPYTKSLIEALEILQ